MRKICLNLPKINYGEFDVVIKVCFIMKNSSYSISCDCFRFAGILNEKDLEEIDPIRSKFLLELKELASRKSKIVYDNTLSLEAKSCQIKNLSLNDSSTESAVRLEDLAMTFSYLPSSRVFGFSSVDLVKNGADIDVSGSRLRI